MSTLATEVWSGDCPEGVECRVTPRHECGLETTCQPIAARSDHDMAWPAKIRDMSLLGVGLVLSRRFERGAGLAIDIPETPSAPADTLLVRVVHATAQPDGKWLLGCTFVSPLSEDELERLLDLGRARHDTVLEQELVELKDGRSFIVPHVTWEGVDANGMTVRRRVRRLHWNGLWPPAKNAVLRIWFGKSPHLKAYLRIDGCRQRDGLWFVKYTLLHYPPDGMVPSFSCQA
jgi:hypothetical protein